MPSIQGTGTGVAVVGMGCWYPGASELREFWENILARRCQFRQLPNQRLPLADYYDPDPAVPDKTYGSRAAVIDGFEFDWIGRRVPKGTYETADVVHWLALEVALKALADSGYDRSSVPIEQSGLVVGNTLTGEQTRASSMRLRWPYVRRSLLAAAAANGLSAQATEDMVTAMKEYYKSVFPPITEDSLSGGLSNTIAGRICNVLNFHGGGYTVDGACSSSLIAIATAANALVNGDLNLAIAGGVDVSIDTFEMIGFAKTGALTAKDMKVYDRTASGFIPGEGCGFVVLKRLEDAQTNGDDIYAVLRGWGISSDGRGGITAPNRMGQATALKRAYQRAGYRMQEVAFVEGHGTGTPVGDRAELEGIALALTADGEVPARACGVTSFKSLVGHTKAAAGVGGFIKAVMAVNRRVMPPTAGIDQPNPLFEGAAQCLYPIREGEVRNRSELLRAGVSAMGFGGINCHVTLESGDRPSPKLAPRLDEQALLVTSQKTELFVWSADSFPSLLQKVRATQVLAQGMSVAEMVDLAVLQSQRILPQLPIRAAAIAANSPTALTDVLQRLERLIQTHVSTAEKLIVSPEQDIWLSRQKQSVKVGFLFPGQGSQRLNMARHLVKRYGWASDLVAQADRWLAEVGAKPVSAFVFRSLDRGATAKQIEAWTAQLSQTEIAQPAICLASLLWQQYLQRLGMSPVAVGGHSLGELTAFCAAGAFEAKSLLQL
ncbi:MAG: beta-ketoacyl synthase N-terminal-like domain-containing protein, partial [Cyanobacteria bacterium J06626_18]